MCCAGLVYLFCRGICPRVWGFNEYVGAVVLEFFDRILNIAEGAVVARLCWGCKVDLWIPAASQLFNAGDIDGAIVKVFIQALHVPGDEVAIDRD